MRMALCMCVALWGIQYSFFKILHTLIYYTSHTHVYDYTSKECELLSIGMV